MGLSIPTSSPHGDGASAAGARRRRPSHPAETARRKAWAREWGEVGKAWKRQQQATEGR